MFKRESAREHSHPTAGPMSFNIDIIGAPHEPDQRLVVYTAEPDSPTARVLPIPASWNSAPH
ncbi:MmyB family transcriptional regulator [Streptomyces sp. 900105755]